MSDKTKYQPPYAITLTILNLVAEIGELIGRYTILAEQNLTPRLRRENRIRTIQASLAIENNTLTLEQVTAVLLKHVISHQKPQKKPLKINPHPDISHHVECWVRPAYITPHLLVKSVSYLTMRPIATSYSY